MKKRILVLSLTFAFVLVLIPIMPDLTAMAAPESATVTTTTPTPPTTDPAPQKKAGSRISKVFAKNTAGASDGVWDGSGDVTWTIDNSINKFKRLRLDGVTVGEEYYTLTQTEDGSGMVITLSEDFIKTLAPDTYQFRVQCTNGYVIIRLTVQ